MKKFFLLLVLGLSTTFIYGQAANQISFGAIGASWEIPVHKDIAIAPTAFTNWDLDHLTLGVKGNYYFDGLFGLTEPWDVYGGVNVGFGLALGNGNTSKLNIGLHAGGRWFWSDKWGVYLEIGGGSLGGQGGIGITMKL